MYIKSNSEVGSGEKVYLWFYSALAEQVGAVYLYFRSPPQYVLRHCMSMLNPANFPSAFPPETDKVLRIALTRTSGVRLIIHCNEVEVLNVLLSDSTCSDTIKK